MPRLKGLRKQKLYRPGAEPRDAYPRGERPDYAYLKQVFCHRRAELEIDIPRQPKRLPHVPSDEEIHRYYETVWRTRHTGNLVLRSRLTHYTDLARRLRPPVILTAAGW